ncbi:MAG TPA: PA2779 family protein [Pseudomonadales bacterium]|nr:PA2779 family protein [Pseudomonadales bacterium]
MRSKPLTRVVLALLLGAQFALAGINAQAGVIGTDDYLTAGDGFATVATVESQAQLQRVRDFLAEDRVQAQFTRLGVDAAQAEARVASLSASELAMLDARLAEMPAGGSVVAVVGIVFVVLLILELVGVTDIFKSI